MKSITERHLKKQMMVSCDFIDLGITNEKHWFISFSKVEEDLIYYNYGYELVNSEDINFISLVRGLDNIKTFIKFVNQRNLFKG